MPVHQDIVKRDVITRRFLEKLPVTRIGTEQWLVDRYRLPGGLDRAGSIAEPVLKMGQGTAVGSILDTVGNRTRSCKEFTNGMRSLTAAKRPGRVAQVGELGPTLDVAYAFVSAGKLTLQGKVACTTSSERTARTLARGCFRLPTETSTGQLPVPEPATMARS